MGQPLAVRVMRVREYADDGDAYHDRTYHLPAWEQVEAAVRALDHFRLPFVSLGLEDAPAHEGWFTVYGGPDGYAVTAWTREAGPVKYYDPDPARGGGMTDVWWSGAGYFPPACYVTRDAELVVRLARAFAEAGRLDPAVEWRPGP